VKAVGADHIVAIEADDPVAVAIGDIGRVGIEVVRGDVLGVMDDVAFMRSRAS